MDNLTHGLLGLAIGSLRRPDGVGAKPGRRLGKTDRAVLLASVVASELPDLDGLWPAQNEVLGAIFVHRGISHALVFAPVWAALGAGLAWSIFRPPRFWPSFFYALGAVVFAHLCADAWTGWGTRLFLPFSDARLSWDWMVVVDPIFTAALVLGGIAALAWRARWRMFVVAGFVIACAYLGTRVALKQFLETKVAEQYADAREVTVFPDWFGLMGWRFVVEYPETYVTGNIRVGESPRAALTHDKPATVPASLAQIPTVTEALAWARFPVLAISSDEDSTTARVADLRYHLYGKPTLSMVVDVDRSGNVLSAKLDRPVSGRALMQEWRRGPPP